MRSRLGNFMMGGLCASLIATNSVQAAGGLQLDGVDDYVTMGVAPGLGSETFTLETWFQRTGTGSTVSSGTATWRQYPARGNWQCADFERNK